MKNRDIHDVCESALRWLENYHKVGENKIEDDIKVIDKMDKIKVVDKMDEINVVDKMDEKRDDFLYAYKEIVELITEKDRCINLQNYAIDIPDYIEKFDDGYGRLFIEWDEYVDQFMDIGQYFKKKPTPADLYERMKNIDEETYNKLLKVASFVDKLVNSIHNH